MEKIAETRNILTEFFKSQADLEGISVNPSDDLKMLDLFDRIFDESREGRRINIDFDPESTLPLNGFCKKFGLEPNEVSLLTIFVSETPADFERLWTIYRGWMHDGMSAEALLEVEAR
jgi:hypothetical protein